MNNQQITKIASLLCFVFALFLVLSVMVVFVIWLTLPPPTKEFHKSKKYQYLQYDPSKDETAMGLISLPDDHHLKIPLTYLDEPNTLVLISDIGTNQFKCLGTCSCVSPRRSSAAIRPIYLLISAFTATLAIQTAREHFEKDCASQLAETCSGADEKVKSYVEKCEDVHLKEEFEKNKKKELICDGRCKMNNQIRREDVFEEALKMDCDKIELTKTKTVDCSKRSWEECVQAAKNLFFKEDLDTHCQEFSRKTFEDKEEEGEYRAISLCIGVPIEVACYDVDNVPTVDWKKEDVPVELPEE